MALRNPPEDPITRALNGDEDALEEVVGSLAAPTFDLAVHLFGSGAEQPTIGALAELAQALRAGPPLPTLDPLAIPARHLLSLATDAPVVDQAFSQLNSQEYRGVLASMVVDLDGEALAYALQIAASDAQALLKSGHSKLAGRDSLRDLLDAHASKFAMPRGMVDRALAD
jgi:hypothetical protein